MSRNEVLPCGVPSTRDRFVAAGRSHYLIDYFPILDVLGPQKGELDLSRCLPELLPFIAHKMRSVTKIKALKVYTKSSSC
jgi:hypothetical protein